MKFDPKCCCVTQASKVKVEEIGRKAVFVNEERREFVKIRFDGCIVKGQTSADWIVSVDATGSAIVELKGRDVEHAIGQVIATGNYLRAHVPNERVAALIICSQYPSINTIVQKGKQRFAKQCKGPLHVVSRNREFDFECILSFRGPDRK